MRRRVAPVVLTGVTLVLAAQVGAAPAQEPPCQVGGTPSHVEFYQSHPRPQSEVLVIGCAQTAIGPIEIVAFDSRFGLCVFVDKLDQLFGFGQCPVTPPSNGRAIGVTQWGLTPGHPRFTDVSGPLSPHVATVSASFRRKGRVRTAQGTVAQITGDLVERLHQEAPFGYFVAIAQGCARSSKIDATAFDATGGLVGSDRGFRLPGPFDTCGAIELPPGGDVAEPDSPRHSWTKGSAGSAHLFAGGRSG
jgi:hypothetical protein